MFILYRKELSHTRKQYRVKFPSPPIPLRLLSDWPNIYRKPTDWLCQIRLSSLWSQLYSMYFMHLGKNCSSLNGFQSHRPWQCNVHEVVWPAKQRSSVILCTFVQALICIIWLSMNPPVASNNSKFMSANYGC